MAGEGPDEVISFNVGFFVNPTTNRVQTSDTMVRQLPWPI